MGIRIGKWGGIGGRFIKGGCGFSRQLGSFINGYSFCALQLENGFPWSNGGGGGGGGGGGLNEGSI